MIQQQSSLCSRSPSCRLRIRAPVLPRLRPFPSPNPSFEMFGRRKAVWTSHTSRASSATHFCNQLVSTYEHCALAEDIPCFSGWRKTAKKRAQRRGRKVECAVLSKCSVRPRIPAQAAPTNNHGGVCLLMLDTNRYPSKTDVDRNTASSLPGPPLHLFGTYTNSAAVVSMAAGPTPISWSFFMALCAAEQSFPRACPLGSSFVLKSIGMLWWLQTTITENQIHCIDVCASGDG